MKEWLQKMTSLRRELHRIPELAGQEFLTQEVVLRELAAAGWQYRKAETGVIADLDAGRDRRIALRADMDALPIEERADCPYRSRHEGVMHACGHDGHMAILLAYAHRAAAEREKLTCDVRLIFQPAEEGGGGAQAMIAAGALEGVDEIYALHLAPNLACGSIGLGAGALQAGDEKFDVLFEGRSAHCAEAAKGRDALLAAASLAASFAEIGKKGDVVLHCGTLAAGSCRNAVADAAKLEATLRYFTDKERERAMNLVAFELKYACDRFGVKGRVVPRGNYIPLVNNRRCVDKLAALAGERAVPVKRGYAAEDFAFFLRERPGALVWLGAKSDPETRLHAGDFDFDETCLLAGLNLWMQITENKTYGA